MIVEINARITRTTNVGYISVDWQHRVYGQAFRKAGGGIVWSDLWRS